VWRPGALCLELPGSSGVDAISKPGGDVGHAVNYVPSCWAHHESTAPMVPVKVDGNDTEALLDSGSMVTLLTMSLLNQDTETW
jgi:hypothetical protein